MASRRDQLQSYQFRSQRVVSAFVMRETDPAQSPLRRGGGALLIGAMVTVLVAATFGVIGILTKTGGNSWKVDGTVVVEKESGASFVYADGVLHPALNYASALLAAGHAPPVVRRVSANSLAGIPRTTVIGIPGAPNSLPDAKHLSKLPWTVCSTPIKDSAGTQTTTVQLSVAAQPAGSRDLPEGDGMLATDGNTGSLLLIWNKHRYKVDKTVKVFLFADTPSTQVGTALLETLPVGADIREITVPKAGQPSTAIPDRRNGDVLVAQTGSGPLYYLVFDDGLATLTELQKDIAVKSGGQPQPVDVGVANDAKKSNALKTVIGAQAPPVKPPHLTVPGAGDPVCARFTADGGDPVLSLGGSAPSGGVPTIGHTTSGATLADWVAVPAGQAALVTDELSPGYTIGWVLVTDTGTSYALHTREDVLYLGYNPDSAPPVPSALLGRIPAGPALDHTLASDAAPVSSK